MTETKQLPALTSPTGGLIPALTPQQATENLQRLKAIVSAYLIPKSDAADGDYGKMPGTNKDTLFKSGAEKLLEIYRLHADPIIVESKEDWRHVYTDSKGNDWYAPLFDYTIKMVIKTIGDDVVIGAGLGSCNSYEAKYLWRQLKRTCPSCGEPALAASKDEWGGGYYCNRKANGCGKSWQRNDSKKRDTTDEEVDTCRAIDAQPIGKAINEDIASTKNTVLKMAKKRALVDGTIAATHSSGIFTQDVEDFLDAEIISASPTVTPPSKSKRQKLEEWWFHLKRKARGRGFTDKAVTDYKHDLEAQGIEEKEICKAAEKYFLHDSHEEDTHDTAYRDAETGDIIDTSDPYFTDGTSASR